MELSGFDPVLVGTIPIDIDVPGSDLDILCCWQDAEEFCTVLKRLFSTQEGFCIRMESIRGQISVIASFILEGWEVEIFGQNIPTRQQMGYRHMLVEERIVKERGDQFRHAVRSLKMQGIKTEPAFAQLLGLGGDPYLALLELE